MLHPNAQDPTRLVVDAGGVMRTGRLKEAGVTRSRMERAVDAGAIRRIRRGWVAVPEADPLLVAAAFSGAVVTCVSQAARLGL